MKLSQRPSGSQYKLRTASLSMLAAVGFKIGNLNKFHTKLIDDNSMAKQILSKPLTQVVKTIPRCFVDQDDFSD